MKPQPSQKVPLRARIEAFFDENQGEWLSPADIALKFDANLRSVYRRVWELKQAGKLESLHVVRRRPS